MTEQTCGICLTEIDTAITTTECGHHFHTECLACWGRTKGTRRTSCPICRSSIRAPPLEQVKVVFDDGETLLRASRVTQMADLLPMSEQRAIGYQFAEWLTETPLRVRTKSALLIQGREFTLLSEGFYDRSSNACIELLVNDQCMFDSDYAESLLLRGSALPTIHVPRRLGTDISSRRRITRESCDSYIKAAMWIFCNEPSVIELYRRTGFAVSIPCHSYFS